MRKPDSFRRLAVDEKPQRLTTGHFDWSRVAPLGGDCMYLHVGHPGEDEAWIYLRRLREVWVDAMDAAPEDIRLEQDDQGNWTLQWEDQVYTSQWYWYRRPPPVPVLLVDVDSLPDNQHKEMER